ncbi:MAG: hypothetical protein DMF63_09040 [Acidobacteria bacterium]|nr:MAG: hypothetical protein DMF63_09040 [Acidobacteriota bacterium]
MELFQKLGAEIEEIWREQNYNEEVFPKIAAEALARADIPSSVSAWDVIEWTLDQNELPRQKDPQGSFGDPPITLFVAPRFYIDVYFWLNGTTQIHQHGFCGAFQVMLGSSIHSWYEFERTEAVNTFIETGEMTLKVCELLKVGDVQEIRAGRQYIHCLFHLDQPSATIVVRTDKSPLYLPQFSYQKPNIAIDPFFDHESTSKKLQALAPLFQVNYPETDRLINKLLEASDFQTSFSVLSTIHNHLSGTFLGDLFNLEGPAARFANFVSIVKGRHGLKAERLDEVFQHRDRLNDLVRRRGFVTNPEHRFFFALLLNVDSRDRILSLVKSRFPDADPIEKILDWTYDLAQTRVVGVNTPNALGIEGFDDVDLSIVEHLLRGKSEKETLDALVSEYGNEKSEGSDAKIRRIRGSVAFSSLLAE